MHDAGTGLLAAILLFAGTCGGLAMPVHACADAWIDVACVAATPLAATAWMLRRRGWWGWIVGMVLPALVGFVVAGTQVQRCRMPLAVGHAAREPSLVRFRAAITEPFRPPDPARTDVLDRFQVDAETPTCRGVARLSAWMTPDGDHPAEGLVSLSLAGADPGLAAGDQVQGIGWLTPPRRAANPGERDMTSLAWRRHVVGTIRLETPPERVTLCAWWSRARDWLQSAVDANLVRRMPASGADDVATLVVAMTSGRERPGYAKLRETFASTGLSHFLAISGFNVAVLFGSVSVGMELLRVPGTMRGGCLAVMGLLFLAAVDIEVSVLRAGIAGVMTGTSLALSRGWRADGLLSAAAMGTLVIDPWMAWNPGFQLSYAAVLALRYGSGPVERCLCRLGMPACRGVRLALSASVAAWLASMPITLAWFGSVSPWCAVTSTVLGPLAASLTVTASLCAMVGWIPPMDWLLCPLLWMQGWLFLTLVEASASLPCCQWSGVPWPSWLALLVLGWLAGLWRGWPCPKIWRWLVVVPIAAWGAFAHAREPATLDRSNDDRIRWTALSIGDGSVHLIECGGCTVLFDAGSISIDSSGSSVVVPALKALGVETIDVVVLSHPHLDHFSAVPEVVQALGVGRVVVTDLWRLAPPDSAPATLSAWLQDRGVPVSCFGEGDSFMQAPLTWTAVHPPKGFRPRAVNDGSLCFTVRHPLEPDRPVSLMLGDAQDEAVARLIARTDIRNPWAMELPHHGGWRPAAAELCRIVGPLHVLQSTGARRFVRDRFGDVLTGVWRGVTCRDGALRFSLILPDRTARLERWWRGAWRPVVP
jgi:competence protein ComEC